MYYTICAYACIYIFLVYGKSKLKSWKLKNNSAVLDVYEILLTLWNDFRKAPYTKMHVWTAL